MPRMHYYEVEFWRSGNVSEQICIIHFATPTKLTPRQAELRARDQLLFPDTWMSGGVKEHKEAYPYA